MSEAVTISAYVGEGYRIALTCLVRPVEPGEMPYVDVTVRAECEGLSFTLLNFVYCRGLGSFPPELTPEEVEAIQTEFYLTATREPHRLFSAANIDDPVRREVYRRMLDRMMNPTTDTRLTKAFLTELRSRLATYQTVPHHARLTAGIMVEQMANEFGGVPGLLVALLDKIAILEKGK